MKYNEYKKSKEKYRELSDKLKALSNPTRFFIVEKLCNQECSVWQLTEMIGCSMPTISRHLYILMKAGIINYSESKNRHIYKLISPTARKLLEYSKKL
ncbi:MAG: winged helix-turn-helix transcriptional regulator [Elusimicrobiaceae bacterium]|jgi:DNA-binding transcriptional ArsR family regulator|nr:winged helix-turn-helix transcriptional regulator [Elusimicrobiaceae bacterium]MBT3955174.1 winged helix-turn-helix transcriptional regulator [Elusimicrobiaceae bacterium]MBT4008673.1 winged helix-turn-helix transcriptional regulator [Elusimicrobiaceae bacterium]MBT4402471.1 winged helix-turn-helix transcriptional regulator [Elusimicrobiaceae bacterium]MBT4439417.1 winged helix-turn-helix transcriptional regulator [Elusimicrobiaceae bacterium]